VCVCVSGHRAETAQVSHTGQLLSVGARVCACVHVRVCVCVWPSCRDDTGKSHRAAVVCGRTCVCVSGHRAETAQVSHTGQLLSVGARVCVCVCVCARVRARASLKTYISHAD